MTISVDGRCVVGAGNDGRVHVWDAATGLCALTLRGHEGGVWATALSDDARLLATSGDDGQCVCGTYPMAAAARCAGPPRRRLAGDDVG